MFTAKNLTEKFYHPELTTKTVEPKSKRDFMPLPGVSGARCIKSPLPPFTKGGMNTATLNKGGGTIMPEGLSKTTLTRLRHPLPEVEGKEFEKDMKLACHPELVSGSQAGFTHRTSPLTKRKAAFTLAEVLITLGIIGVVAAMTLPALIQKNNNRVVETRLQKFYSSINQAVQRAEVDYGDKKYWYQDTNNIETDKDGNPVKGSSTVEKWWNKYMAPYIKTVDIKYDDSGLPIFMFTDGSALKANQVDFMRDWLFYTGNPEKCIAKYGSDTNSRGKCSFLFIFMPGGDGTSEDANNSEGWKYHRNKGFEPYKYNWDGTRNGLINGSYKKCNSSDGTYCTALIQLNGWKIPDDYPFKVSY